MLRTLQKSHPMEVLRTAVSALGALDPSAADTSPQAVYAKGVALTAQLPTLIATHHALRQGREPVAPNNELSHAANFLFMLKGEQPSDSAASLMDKDLILHAEHGSNASSFAARVVTGTGANLYGALTAGVAALSGPAHGGAAEDVMKMAAEIGVPENAAAYIKEKRKQREPIMGFGHRVYRAEDPRARHLRDGVQRLSKEVGAPHWFDVLQAVEKAMQRYARLGVNVNVDFFAGLIYHLHGIASDLFVPIFAMGRVPGWTAQVLEQLERNILIRPLTQYDGASPRSYVALDDR